MFNPLNEKISLLLQEIARLEADRESVESKIRHLYPLASQRQDTVDRIRPDLETIERLTRTIDSKREELIASELLMLNNSIKDLRSTTSQVDDSVKSLQTTTDKLFKSSTKLERLTTLLVYVTIMLAIIAIYNVALILGQSSPLFGAIGVIAIFAGFIYFTYRLYQAVRRGDITPLHS